MLHALSTFGAIVWIKSSVLAFVASTGIFFSLLIACAVFFLGYMVVMAATQLIRMLFSNKYFMKILAFFRKGESAEIKAQYDNSLKGASNTEEVITSEPVYSEAQDDKEPEPKAGDQNHSTLATSDNPQNSTTTADIIELLNTNESAPEILEDLPRPPYADEKAIKVDGMQLKHASPDLQDNKEVVGVAFAQNPNSLQYASDIRQKELFKSNPANLKYMREDLQENIIKYDPANLQDADISLQKKLVELRPLKLQFSSPEVKADIKLVTAAVEQCGRMLEFAAEHVQRAIIAKDATKLQYASFAIKDDKDLVLASVRKNGRLLEYASANLKKDKDVVLAAFNQDNSALEFAEDSIQRAVTTTGPIKLQYASYNIQKESVEANAKILFCTSATVKNDIDIVLKAIKKHPKVLSYAGANAQKSIAIKDPTKLEYASRYIQKEIAEETPNMLQYASHKVQRDVIRTNPDKLQYASPTVQRIEAKADKWASQYTPADFQVYPNITSYEQILQLGPARASFLSNPKVQERTKIRRAASEIYKGVMIKNGSVILPLTEEEASQDLLVAVLSLHYGEKLEGDYLQEIAAEHEGYDREQLIEGVLHAMAEDDKNRLEIILTALSEYSLFGDLKERLCPAISRISSEEKKAPSAMASSLFKDSPKTDKIDFPINVSLLQQLASDPIDGLKNLIKEPLKLLICKSKALGDGGFDEFRRAFIKAVEKDGFDLLRFDIKDELSDEQYIRAATDEVFFPLELTKDYKLKNITATIQKLDYKELMDLIMKLTPTNLYKLEDAILNSNKTDREAKLKDKIAKTVTPNNLCS